MFQMTQNENLLLVLLPEDRIKANFLQVGTEEVVLYLLPFPNHLVIRTLIPERNKRFKQNELFKKDKLGI